MTLTVTRTLIAVAALCGAVTWLIANHEATRMLERPPWWVRFWDRVYDIALLWTTTVFGLVLATDQPPTFVRDWVGVALPPLLVWPALRRIWMIRQIAREATHGIE